jgi:eukaryotic-like serine/threonine-protein kinase
MDARAEQDVRAPKFGSMFVLDPRGTIVAVVYDDEQIQTRSLGRNFSWRTYFHGGPVDLPRHLRTPEIQPIRRPHLSAVFQSTTSGLWKVAVSTPIYGSPDGNSEFLGVLVFTVNLGDFAALRNEQKGDDDRFAVLVDGRSGESQGTILQHPLFKNQVDDPEHLLVDYNQPEYRLTEQQLEQLATNWRYRYIDPLSRAPLGTPYRGSWIAALEPVDLRTRDDTEPARAADLLVVVQELEQAATAPVRQLGTRLVQEGLFALTSSLLVVMLMWYVVLGVWGMPTGRRSGRYGGRTESQPMPGTPTLSATGGMRSAHTQPQSPKESP